MRIAHARERNAPAGAPWRLVAGLDASGEQWLDLEVARRRSAAAVPERLHNSTLFRQPVTTLDDHLARGLRVGHFAEIVESFEPRPGSDEDDAILEAGDLAFGPPILRPTSLRDFYVFEQHVSTAWARRGGEVPEAWYRLPVFYFSNTSELRGPGDAVWAPKGCSELDFELEVGALVDTPAVDLTPDRAADAIGGFFVLNDWSARDLQREETTVRLGPAKGKDFATSIGPWLVTPDELVDVRTPMGYDLMMSAVVRTGGAEGGRVVAVSHGTWSAAHFSFGDMLARASADARLRPGDVVGSGTVGTGCLLEVKDSTLGRYLEPGDEVMLTIERLGSLTTPIVERPRR